MSTRLSRRARLALVSSLPITLAVSSLPAHAAADFSTVTGAVDVSSVETGILAMAVIMIGVGVAIWGSRKLIGFFSR